jgi:hypothetical protein
MSQNEDSSTMQTLLRAPLTVSRWLGHEAVDTCAARASDAIGLQEKAVLKTRPAVLKAVAEQQVTIARRMVADSVTVQHRVIG